jgi:hypothetical protein
MTMTVSESTDVNTLVLWMLPLGGDWRHPTESEAREAMANLIESAHKKLGAGLTSTELLDRWALSEEAEAPAHGPGCKVMSGTNHRDPSQPRYLCTPNCPRQKWEREQEARLATAKPNGTELHSGHPCPECGSKSTQRMSPHSVYCSECEAVRTIRR